MCKDHPGNFSDGIEFIDGLGMTRREDVEYFIRFS